MHKVADGMVALDFRHNPRPELREFQIFSHIVEEGLHLQADIMGAVSSRFYAKSLVTAPDVKRWIAETPGKDVYLVNPWPQWPYSVFNTHDRATIIHGDLEFNARCQAVLDKAGVELDYLGVGRQHNGNHGMSSYWFATPAFWEGFMQDVVWPVTRLTRRELGEELHQFLYVPVQYYGHATHRPGALPFMLERTTNIYVAQAFKARAAFYPRSREDILRACIFPFERDLVLHFGDAVDGWDAAGFYPPEAKAFFRATTQHATHGWLTYMSQFPLSFDHGDPRPRLPWFQHEQASFTPVEA
ncbi:hypothetical protein NBRC116584_02340 [Hydrogenophaga sp. 5NK40-0174]